MLHRVLDSILDLILGVGIFAVLVEDDGVRELREGFLVGRDFVVGTNAELPRDVIHVRRSIVLMRRSILVDELVGRIEALVDFRFLRRADVIGIAANTEETERQKSQSDLHGSLSFDAVIRQIASESSDAVVRRIELLESPRRVRDLAFPWNVGLYEVSRIVVPNAQGLRRG